MKEDIHVDVDKGDIILTGRFKNHREKVKSFGHDENDVPLINGKKAITFRIPKDKDKKDMKKEQLKQQLKKEIRNILNEERGRKSFRAHKFEEENGVPMKKTCKECGMIESDCICDENTRSNKKLKEQLKPAILAILRESQSSEIVNYIRKKIEYYRSKNEPNAYVLANNDAKQKFGWKAWNNAFSRNKLDEYGYSGMIGIPGPPNMVCEKCGYPANACECDLNKMKNKNEKAVMPKGLQFQKDYLNENQEPNAKNADSLNAMHWFDNLSTSEKKKVLGNSYSGKNPLVYFDELPDEMKDKVFKKYKGTIELKKETTPPGKEKLVRALKKNPKVDNPWAVAWSQYNKEKGK